MSNRQTLQNIWSMTDKTAIDIMTKHKSSAIAGKDNDSNNDNDSDSAESSNGSFVAVPQEFRPDLSSYLRKKKAETNKILLSQNSQTHSIQSPNLTNECETSERISQIMKKSSSVLKTKVASNTPNCKVTFTTTEDAHEKMASNSISFQNKCRVPISKSPIRKEGNKLQYEHIDKFGDSLQLCQRKNQDETNKVSQSTVFQKPNLTNDSKRSERIFQILETIPSQKTESVEKTPNAKVVRFDTLQDDTSKRKNKNSLAFQKQRQISFSKPLNKEWGNKLQYEHIGIEHETIQLNFELPSKGELKFERFFQQKETVSKNGNTDSHFKTRHNNYDRKYKVSTEENIAKWKSELSSNAKSYSEPCKIGWTVIREEKTFRSKRQNDEVKKNTEKELINECKFKNLYQIREQPLRENFQKIFNSSLQYETTFREQSNHNPGKYKEVEHHFEDNECLETAFYKNSLQLDNHSNYNSTKHRNYNTEAKVLSMNKASSTRQCPISEQAVSSNNNSTYPTSRRVLKEEIEQQNQEFDSKPNSSNCIKVKDTEENLKFILDDIKDISDFVIGSHTSLSMLISFYKEWRLSRQELITHFEQLEKNLKKSSENFTRYREIINVANTGATLAAAIPHPYVSTAARIVSALTSLFSTFLNRPNTDNVDDSNDITVSLFKDTQASTDLYMYGLQCNQQFEETSKEIEKFHSNAAKNELKNAVENVEIAKFVEGILEYRPKHCIFYKKVHKCFQELLQTGTSSEAERLCEPFLLGPSKSVDVIRHLNWRFQYDNFNSESVRYELEQLHMMIQDSNATSLKDLLQKIQNCIRILKDELTFVDQSIKDISLFDKGPSYKG